MAEPAHPYKRETSHRIFVNRSLHLNKIRFFGFDMDYTLAQYKSPQYETLSYNLIIDKLIDMGYPEDLRKHEYDPNFPVRGMWFDKLHGTLLKMDQFGNILVCLLGFKTLQGEKLREMYPNKFVKYNEDRIIIMNTLFDLPKLYALACITQVLTTSDEFKTVSEGVQSGSLYMSYTSIYEDVDKAMSWLHDIELKKRTVADLDHYVERDPNILVLLERLRSNGAKTFLLTNSDYLYTDSIMTFITSSLDSTKKWTDYFDYIVTDARKPSFFKNGTVLRQINKDTGKAVIGHHIGPLVSGQIYSGGNCKIFSELIGARGKDVLFVGDHIFGDIVKSKKTNGWRTFLIIPELINEIYVWKTKRNIFERLSKLDEQLGQIYKDMNIDSLQSPDISTIKTEIRSVANEMESAYGRLGSIFRNGSRHTFFSSQALRYADLYSFSCINLIYYPLFYMFRAPQMLMPHESTVSHEESPNDSIKDFREIPYGIRRRSERFIGENIDEEDSE